jgi:hypothetical protein
MENLRRQLKQLKAKAARLEAGTAAPALTEHEQRQSWLVRTGRRHAERTPPDAKHARSLIGLFRLQGYLATMSADELIERIIGWQPAPEGGRARGTVECEVYRAIYHREAGTEHMIVPRGGWREAFDAGAELRRLHGAIPPQTFAGWVFERISRMERGATEEELERFDRGCCEPHGITPELERCAVGPDHDSITQEEEEARWRIDEHMTPLIQGDWGWQVEQHLERLFEESDKSQEKESREESTLGGYSRDE